MDPRDLGFILLFAACAVVAWQMGAPRGIDQRLCAFAGFIFGPLLLVFLLFVPKRDGTTPTLAGWPGDDEPPLPPREPRYVAPPPPQD